MLHVERDVVLILWEYAHNNSITGLDVVEGELERLPDLVLR